MNPMEYMQTVKNMTLESIAKNDEDIAKLTELMTTATEYKEILSYYSTNCDEIISILTHQTPQTV